MCSKEYYVPTYLNTHQSQGGRYTIHTESHLHVQHHLDIKHQLCCPS